ncbi:MAG: CinA family protein [Muribaculaceae bacterium]|nr:CinA family protein [Muribaculaceae bacterium]
MTDGELAACVLEALRNQRCSIATAESCTGGNIAHELTLVAGASDVVNGGVVAYCNEVKHRILGVSKEDLNAYGAVSEPVVRQMADGAAALMHADYAVATSGIAGPGGGTPAKPVGTVWTAVHRPSGTFTHLLNLKGSGGEIIGETTRYVLEWLLQSISRD